MTAKASPAEREVAIERLRELLQPGDTVYTILRHVSRSGMQREISLVLLRGEEPYPLSFWAAMALGMRLGSDDGIIVGGTGMDMGFHLVYSLGRVLFPEGFKVEGYGRNGDTSGWDKDGGYALKQRWL